MKKVRGTYGRSAGVVWAGMVVFGALYKNRVRPLLSGHAIALDAPTATFFYLSLGSRGSPQKTFADCLPMPEHKELTISQARVLTL